MRAIPTEAVNFIAEHEACFLKAYPDPGSADGTPWTIGWGHTEGVKKGDTCTRAQAKVWLREDLEEARERLYAKIGAVADELTVHQYAALLSFVFNVGTGNPKKREWGIWGVLRKRHFDQVPGELIKFVNNDGKKMRGLVNRRTAEIKLWSTDEPGSVDHDPPSSVTRATPTPPTPSDPVPPQKDAGIIATGGAAILTGATAVAQAAPDVIKQGIALVEPYEEKSSIAQNITSALAGAGSVIAVVAFVLVIRKKLAARR